MGTMSLNRVGGLSLMIGIILAFIAAAFYPGALIVDAVDQADFAAVIAAMTDSDSLAHVLTLTMILAIMLQAFGLYSLLRVQRAPGIVDSALRLAVAATMFAWGIYIIAMGMRHVVLHIATHGISISMGDAANEDMALAVYSAHVGALYGFIAIGAVTSFILGLAVAARFKSMNIYRIAGYGLALKGVAEVFNLALIQHLHDVDFGVIAAVASGLLYLGGVWLFIIGFGIFRGEKELVPESEEG